jgi:hypothetical protein
MKCDRDVCLSGILMSQMSGASERICGVFEFQLPVTLHLEISAMHSRLWAILLIRTGKVGREALPMDEWRYPPRQVERWVAIQQRVREKVDD